MQTQACQANMLQVKVHTAASLLADLQGVCTQVDYDEPVVRVGSTLESDSGSYKYVKMTYPE